MRTLITWTILLAAATGSATAQAPAKVAPKRAPFAAPAPAQPQAAPKSAPAPAPLDPAAVKAQQLAYEKAQQEMGSLLAEWEKQSQKLTSLDVQFERIDKLGAWGDAYYQGRAMLKSPDLACLEFRKVQVDANGKPLQPRKLEAEAAERIVCTGKEVLQYAYDEKVVYVFPLEKEVRQKALQQGPLPFLFNMKAADAKRRYSMTLMKQDEKEYLIGIVPNLEIDRQSFTKAFLWLNKSTFLPNHLWLFPVANKERQEFHFEVIRPNEKLADEVFAATTKIEGWKTIFNPGGDAPANAQGPAARPPAAGAQAPPAGRPVAQPAMRPAARPR